MTTDAAVGESSSPRAAGGRRAGPHTQRYLRETFVELCRIDSPSGSERACAERVRAELAAVGVETVEDASRQQTGSDVGNLLARIPGRDAARCVLLCAHLDTVPALAPLEPVLVDGFYENANEAILGADNKAAVAVLLALARELAGNAAAVDVELLFTVGEEVALAGARAFDASVLRADFGYVFDHATPIGEVIVASPSHFRIDAVFRGTAAHAGIRPQDGRSAILAAARAIAAMPLGSLDGGETSANVGLIDGGSAMNVVPERCAIVAEVRSLRDERAEALAGELVEHIHQAANAPECECDVDVSVQRMFSGYRLSPGAAAVRVAEAALADCGFHAQRVTSGGASDANALIVQGLSVVNLANGTERNHEPGERVSSQALDDMLDVALSLLEHAAALT